MRQLLKARRAGVPAVAAVIGALIATPAFADVTVSPPSAVQGSGENLTFHVTNTGQRPVGTVTLRLSDDTPVAEVYPLSVDDWAPKIVTRQLSTPLTSIHDGAPVTETASAVIWISMPGKAIAPGRSADLSVAIGPLPTLSTMQFTVVTAYTDGKPGPAMPAVTLNLTPAPPGQAAAGHAGHEGALVTEAPAVNEAGDTGFAQVAAEDQRGPSLWSIGGWVVAAIALIAMLMLGLRGRHRAEEDDEPDEDEARPSGSAGAGDEPAAGEAVAAGKWSFRG